MSTPLDAQADAQNVSPPQDAPASGAVTPKKPAFRWLIPLLLLALASSFLYRSPYSASSLEIVPDSVEYAVGAQRIALLGRYDIEINHRPYPPRYAPWFSLLLAPVYRLTGGDMGSGILVVFALALAGVLAVYALGCRLANGWEGLKPEWAGAGAVLCLLSFKEYRTRARYIMTDLPATVVGLLCCLLYLRMQTRPRTRDYVLVGLLAGLAAAMRYEGFVLLFPFLALAWQEKAPPQALDEAASKTARSPRTETTSETPNAQASGRPVRSRAKWQTRFRNILLLCAPTVCVTCATALYNAQTFGNWQRSGYHYWNAVPYDYTALVWSPRYIPNNLFVLAAKQSVLIIILGFVGWLLLRRRQNSALNSVLRFMAWACVPPGLAHLIYFSSDVRFYLLPLTLWAAVGGAGLATLLPARLTHSTRWLVGGLAATLLLTPRIHRAFDSEPERRRDADALNELTPANAVIVTELDPVYLEPFVLRGSYRLIIPLTRQVEYASKLVTPERIPQPLPPPHDAEDARSPGMRTGGAQEVIEYTADEAPDQVIALARTDGGVYVDTRFAPKGLDVATLFRNARLENVPEYPWLKRLRVGGTTGRRTSTSQMSANEKQLRRAPSYDVK